MDFNAEQKQAIEASLDEDILITAGAGSGKTKVLSEHVFQLVSDPKSRLKPSELLVLTFTNNAAHEMKSRIVARFAGKNGNPALAAQMLSAHVQTFDSFNQYLVSSYADRLGLSSQLMVMDETVLNSKKTEALEKVFERHYADPALRKQMVETISKFAWKKDDILKTSVLALDDMLAKLTRDKRESFVKEYAENYLSEAKCKALYHELVENAKQSIKDAIRLGNFNQQVGSGEFFKPEKAEELLGSPGFWNQDLAGIQFEEDKVVEPLKNILVSMLALEDDAFMEEATSFSAKYPHLIGRAIAGVTSKAVGEETCSRIKASWEPMKKLAQSKGEFTALKGMKSCEEETARLLSFAPDIALLFSLVKEMDEELENIKRATNSFSFSDISEMAIRLLTEQEFADIAEATRSRFRYIMVDEYQDTNDAQEILLGSLLAPNAQGQRAHLFCVGDAKQSIYAFRNSNVALFRVRQAAYQSGEGHRVIAMNKNYRSGNGLLKDLNYIFSFYVRLDHGSIDYKDPMETLQYDEEVNLYREPYADFGVTRLISPYPTGEGTEFERISAKEWEAKAILNDIKTKVATGFKVYDRALPGLRPCRYSDFLILMRTKSQFGTYQELFNEHGVKLNNVLHTNLREVGPIMVIQSLLGIFAYVLYGEKTDVKHLFASVARSYAFEYDDERIYALVSSKDDAFKKDPLWIKIKGFCDENKDLSFRDIFVNMLNEFHLVERLYRIGSIADMCAKIESLYASAVSLESVGEGLEAFVKMLSTMKKHDLDFGSESLVRGEDAVDIMTIHASKGLEQKIVYLPVSANQISMGGFQNKPMFDFHEDTGFCFRDYSVDFESHLDDEEPYEKFTQTLSSMLLSQNKARQDPEVDEHVRLFYVALTRAENQVIIVGHDNGKKENPYAMLKCAPHGEVLDESFLAEKVNSKAVEQEDYDCYKEKKAKALSGNWQALLKDNMLPETSALYRQLFDQFGPKADQENLKKVGNAIKIAILSDYCDKLGEHSDNLDLLAKIYFLANFPDLYAKAKDKTFASLLSTVQNEETDGKDSLDEEGLEDWDSPIDEEADDLNGDEDSEQGYGTPIAAEERPYLSWDEATWKAKISEFPDKISAFCDSIKKTGVKGDSQKKENNLQNTLDYYLGVLSRAVDGKAFLFGTSFRADDYADRVSYFDYVAFEEEASVFAPALPKPKVDDRHIELPVRVKKRASKTTLHLNDEERESTVILDRGVYLHRLLELLDFSTFDTSYIPDPKDRALIDKVLQLPIMQKAHESTVYSEYGYYDEQAATTGYIDLLFEKDGHYTIVDYKSSNIDDEDYVNQLLTYRRNVSYYFGAKEEDIDMYLLSITKCKLKKIDA